MTKQTQPVVGIDLFCGVGGLSAGLRDAGVRIAAGIDIDPRCKYPYEENIEVPFIERDVTDVTAEELDALWPAGVVRLLAGCAPCQPFSPYRRGVDTSGDEKWPLLREFARLVRETLPELVTMENVPRIGRSAVFVEFVSALEELGYHVDWRSCYGPRYGLPQHRRRLVLVASLAGAVSVPEGDLEQPEYVTVRDAIGQLPAVASGQTHAEDALHVSRRLSPLNLRRVQASTPGGTWEDWPEELRAPCHRKESGSTFTNVYARMSWDEPSPTVTTLVTNFGAGRFGHPEQDRALTLREAAILQGFSPDYTFVKAGERAELAVVSRLIGNAVPPPIAKAVGQTLVQHAARVVTTR